MSNDNKSSSADAPLNPASTVNPMISRHHKGNHGGPHNRPNQQSFRRPHNTTNK